MFEIEVIELEDLGILEEPVAPVAGGQIPELWC